MRATKHTATPWGLCHHLQSPEHDASCQCGYRGSIWSADGEHIVLEMGSSPDHDGDGKLMGHTMPQADRATQLADAAFIVTAVNAYDDHVSRVEALERENAELRMALENISSRDDHGNFRAKKLPNPPADLQAYNDCGDIARAALRDAKERKG